MYQSVKIQTMFIVVGLLFSLKCHAQMYQEKLHVPPEYSAVGQMVYKSYEHMYTELEKYVQNNKRISKNDVDSVTQASIAEYYELNPQVKEAMSKNSSAEATVQPDVQELLNAVVSVIKTFNPRKGIETLADELGKINQKATETLSTEDAEKIYSVTSVTYYSTIYWALSDKKWKKLRATIAEKNK